MSYSQLTLDERYTISKLRMAGYGAGEIARILDRHRSTIHREIQRNSVVQVGRWTYSPSKAQKKRNRRLRHSRRGRQHSELQYHQVETLLKQRWSPEQVAGVLSTQGQSRSASRPSIATCAAIGRPVGSSTGNCAITIDAASGTTAWSAAAGCPASG